ncbi:hypothetical protein Nocox_27880 [Nonomuraea coxensis DSM 45129]|uniref:Secreted protein n=1 Tax=Nonomuraea coxensis DSM 45129 TaxID=1122611 RepID=A0ABX8U8W3_9ACTN|nr:hypothetical protein [Nonomuraea coxensis]QYC43168.1 hypothetical protein Nocox_27880 [Nonomuraea coxensis DSM 45129]
MLPSPRRAVAAAIIAGGLGLLAAPAAQAVVDPFAVSACLTGATADVATLVDPAAPGVPAEVPAVSCLQP